MSGLRSAIAYLLAQLVTRGLFRDFERTGEFLHRGPRIIVANHFNGLVDAVVLVRGLGGLPHFIAKATLFKRLPLRIVLRIAGVVPVYRRADTDDRSGNESSFEEARAVLAKGRSVLIFPEGTVTDEQRLQRIRTGAARIALGAIAEGVENLVIVPVGLTYEDKVAARSRVLVEFGPPIHTDEIQNLAAGDSIDAENRELVRATTDLIRARLASVSPDYGSFLRERVMMSASEIHLRSREDDSFWEPPLADVRAVAQRLAHADREAADHALDSVGRYELALSAVGLRDDQINPPPRVSDLAKEVAKKALIVVLVLPLALLGLVANIIPILLVYLVGATIREPVTKGTARVITALVAFPVAWVFELVLTDPVSPLLALTLMVVGSLFVIVAVQQGIALFEALVTYSAVRARRALLGDLAALRREADAEVDRALVDARADRELRRPD